MPVHRFQIQSGKLTWMLRRHARFNFVRGVKFVGIVCTASERKVRWLCAGLGFFCRAANSRMVYLLIELPKGAHFSGKGHHTLEHLSL